MSNTYAYAYSYSHNVTFVADNMRNALRDVIRESFLDPSNLMAEWDRWISRGIRAWLESGHLREIHIEFYVPGAKSITTRWDFPISYDGSGVDDDMWLDKTYLRQLIAKAPKPMSNCIYRVLLSHAPNPPAVSGMASTSFLDTGILSPRHGGTVVATGRITASAGYWGK
jgi:hypothetical protein